MADNTVSTTFQFVVSKILMKYLRKLCHALKKAVSFFQLLLISG